MREVVGPPGAFSVEGGSVDRTRADRVTCTHEFPPEILSSDTRSRVHRFEIVPANIDAAISDVTVANLRPCCAAVSHKIDRADDRRPARLVVDIEATNGRRTAISEGLAEIAFRCPRPSVVYLRTIRRCFAEYESFDNENMVQKCDWPSGVFEWQVKIRQHARNVDALSFDAVAGDGVEGARVGQPERKTLGVPGVFAIDRKITFRRHRTAPARSQLQLLARGKSVGDVIVDLPPPTPFAKLDPMARIVRTEELPRNVQFTVKMAEGLSGQITGIKIDLAGAKPAYDADRLASELGFSVSLPPLSEKKYVRIEVDVFDRSSRHTERLSGVVFARASEEREKTSAGGSP